MIVVYARDKRKFLLGLCKDETRGKLERDLNIAGGLKHLTFSVPQHRSTGNATTGI